MSVQRRNDRFWEPPAGLETYPRGVKGSLSFLTETMRHACSDTNMRSKSKRLWFRTMYGATVRDIWKDFQDTLEELSCTQKL